MDAIGMGKDALYASKADKWSDVTFTRVCRVYGVDPLSDCGQALLAWDVTAFQNLFSKDIAPPPPPPPRAYDPKARLKSEREAVAEDGSAPNLASLTLFLQQAGPGESIPVSVELVCQPEPVDNFVIAVYRGRLEIDPGAAVIPRDPPPLADRSAVALPRGNGVLTLQRTNASGPGRVAWTVSADDAPIGILRLDDDQVLCRIGEPAAEDIIAAALHAYVKDLDIAEPDPDDDTDDGVTSYSFLRPDGKPLSPAKRQIIKRLLLKDALGPAAKGWHPIARDRRKIVRDGA